MFVLTSRRRDANGKNLRCINIKALKDLLEAKMSSRHTYGKNLQRLTSFQLLFRYILAHRSQLMKLLPFDFDFEIYVSYVTTDEVTSFW